MLVTNSSYFLVQQPQFIVKSIAITPAGSVEALNQKGQATPPTSANQQESAADTKSNNPSST